MTERATRTGLVWHEPYMWQEAGARPAGYGYGYGFGVEKYLQLGMGYFGPEPKRRIRNLFDASGLLEQLILLAPRAASSPRSHAST